MDQSLARGAFCTLALSAAAAVAPVPRLSLSDPPGPAAAFARPVSAPVTAAALALATYRPSPSVSVTDDVAGSRLIPSPRPTPKPPPPPPAPSRTPYPSYTPLPPRQTAVAVSGSPRAYAESLVGAAQFACLDPLWDRESGWNPYARNPSSGAYGIPQALPGSKMASAGPDWATDGDTQVRWGVQYLNDTYGSPCGGWAHENADGWY
jgi:hypothetical protein